MVRKLRKLAIKADKTDVEETTGVRFGVPRSVFLGAMAEQYCWGIPYRFRGKKWKTTRMAKDKNLLRDLEEGDPKVLRCRTILERDNEALERFGITVERVQTPLSSIGSSGEFQSKINDASENSRVTVELTGQGYTYADFSTTFERFRREFVGIVGLFVLIASAIWTSPFLLAIRQAIIVWLHSRGL